MRIDVRVKPRASRRGIETGPDGVLTVRVSEPAEDGRANAAVVELLARHFGVPKSAVTLVRGQRGRQKRIEILDSCLPANRSVRSARRDAAP